MQLRETGGVVGITAQSRQKCFHSALYGDSCSPKKSDIMDWFRTNQIPAGGTINSITPNYFCIVSGDTVTMTETFWGVYGNNNNLQASYSIAVS